MRAKNREDKIFYRGGIKYAVCKFCGMTRNLSIAPVCMSDKCIKRRLKKEGKARKAQEKKENEAISKARRRERNRRRYWEKKGKLEEYLQRRYEEKKERVRKYNQEYYWRKKLDKKEQNIVK